MSTVQTGTQNVIGHNQVFPKSPRENSQRQQGLWPEKYFSLCESCYWSASVFGKDIPVCPLCKSKSVSKIPLTKQEKYRLNLPSSGGIEISFSC